MEIIDEIKIEYAKTTDELSHNWNYIASLPAELECYKQLGNIEKAAVMLREHPEYTVEGIATECGFGSRATFYRLFNEHFGINPKEYVLWDIDTVNWDARRDNMIDLGKELDQLQKEGNLDFK